MSGGGRWFAALPSRTEARLTTDRAGVRQLEGRDDLLDRETGRARLSYDDGKRSAVRTGHRCDPGRRRARPQLGRDDEVDLIRRAATRASPTRRVAAEGRRRSTSRPRRPASSAASIASGGTVIGSPRSHDRITSSERPGSASTNAGVGTSPLAWDSAGQRSPSSDSQPSTRSTPPPNGSASTSSVRRPRRAAVTAKPPARTEAPAPPRPPRTAMTRPFPPPSEPTIAPEVVGPTGSCTPAAPAGAPERFARVASVQPVTP